ncbi:MAG TPA: DNA recombination protein RmuC [Candidatus Paceibacterota bacterium]|nr:DNA recombination protein RmuC [Candidatus Paceibacterota bacterium]
MDSIFFGLIIILLIVVAYRLFKAPAPGKDGGALLLIQNQIQDQQKMLQENMHRLSQTLDARLNDSTKTVLAQAGESTRIVREVTSELTKVIEGQKQVSALNDQLKGLNDILKNTKQRGVLGEYFLEAVLKNVLPPNTYQLQYPFADGTKVDAVIFYQEHVIPIDSKFSLENYNRLASGTLSDDERRRTEDALRADLKNRIDETAKYIKPAENTLDFAFMFIPSEALYYDLLVNKVGSAAERDLIAYAAEKRVYPVSPTTFYAYLQMALQGIRQIEINKSAEQIRKNVLELQRHLARYEEYLEKIGSHLTTTTNAYVTAYKEFGKIDKDIMKIGAIEATVREIADEKTGISPGSGSLL